ncbi:dockerin type I domain-containing protein [Ruminococcus flavefaciens]|uniref:dockerin type I domain-containing protein n=1 Tax=Ruminococcus flavefaciens TaxID=1265 RepID=UPI0026EC4883|nr:dockerin type I domain-containing protein [Ruminococcus flavefaciens]
MKRLVTKLSAMAVSVCMLMPTLSDGVTIGYENAMAASETADILFNNEDRFFVYVGTYGNDIPQFRYLYPTSDGSYNADKVIWEDAPAEISYGDIFVAAGEAPLTKVYPAADDPANSHIYYYSLDEGSELNKAGNCSDLMKKKELTVTSKTYDGSSHWSVRYVDSVGETYYYGLSAFASSLGVDPLDCEVGDVYTYAFYNDNMVIPLAKQTQNLTETMTVEVVEVNESSLLVKPASRPDSKERLTLPKKYLDNDVEPSVGMKLEVTYSDGILETYPEQFGKVIKAVVVSEKNDLLPGQVRVTLVDADTNEPIIYQNDSDTYLGYLLFRECDFGGPYFENPSITDIKINPFIVKYEDMSEERDYTFHVEQSSKIRNYTVLRDEASVVRNDNNSYELVFKLKFTPTGDVNDDGEFNVSDVVLLQKWLLAVPDAELKNWKAADFCNDNKLDVFDQCMMKSELISSPITAYVKPDHEIMYGVDIHVVADDVKMYLGPDTSYRTVTTIPKYTILTELGVQDNNDNWAFINYKGQFGWIQMVNENGERQCIVDYPLADKPVIYLYPEEETDVHVELELTEADLSTTYPKYNNGWDVTAYPDGTLLNKADGSHHRYLFWDAVNCKTRFDLTTGFCVAGIDTESFLKEKLAYMGLNEEEMNEFIVYWLPRMEHNAYNLISFQGDVYTDSAKLDITPAPDSILRVFMAYVPLEEAIGIEPQQLSGFERNGFTVVEWGGSEIRKADNTIPEKVS